MRARGETARTRNVEAKPFDVLRVSRIAYEPMPIFEWHPPKAAKNFREHRLAFEEAITVFDDDRAVDETDPDPDEERFKITGATATGRMVVVTYTEPGPGRIRIISARKATKHEVRAYHQG